MAYKAWFSEQDVPCESLATKRTPARKWVRENVLFFNFEGAALVENSPGLGICEQATERHKKDYPNEYKEFLKSKEPVVVVEPEPVIELTEVIE